MSRIRTLISSLAFLVGGLEQSEFVSTIGDILSGHVSTGSIMKQGKKPMLKSSVLETYIVLRCRQANNFELHLAVQVFIERQVKL